MYAGGFRTDNKVKLNKPTARHFSEIKRHNSLPSICAADARRTISTIILADASIPRYVGYLYYLNGGMKWAKIEH